ncbi:hypothetical protein CRUP_012797 [Coryphaenoides rupestris]|nr:hypothetical protein CRUP_012797 [Coryphaenoides rupestris]
MVNLAPKGRQGTQDLMESQDMRGRQVGRGKSGAIGEPGLRVTPGLPELRGRRARKEYGVLPGPLARMALKGKMDLRVNQEIQAPWESWGQGGGGGPRTPRTNGRPWETGLQGSGGKTGTSRKSWTKWKEGREGTPGSGWRVGLSRGQLGVRGLTGQPGLQDTR